MMSCLVLINPPAIIGIFECFLTKQKDFVQFRVKFLSDQDWNNRYLWYAFSKAIESNIKTLKTVIKSCFLAYLIRRGLVEMIPSASVKSWIKSTHISLLDMPSIRSKCTKINLSCSLAIFVSSWT